MSLQEKLEEILQLKLEDLEGEKKIVELGIDSMKLAQMVKIIDTFTGKRIKYREAIVMTVGDIKSIIENIRVLSRYKPKLYSYKILNEYPHDPEAYTQGLEFYYDTLIESTGLINKSSIRKINYKNGKKYQIKLINNDFFGEGVTILNDTIYQLTWKNNLGIVYKNNFEIIKTFDYNISKEGWGLCNDGEFLYKSDGKICGAS